MTKRHKQSDRDIKEFFADYINAGARKKLIYANSIGRQLTPQELQEIEYCTLYRGAVITLVDSLEKLTGDIIKAYYIEQKSLYNISLEMSYCYEHVSYLKNIGCDNLRKIISGEDIIVSKMSVNMMSVLKSSVNSKEYPYKIPGTDILSANDYSDKNIPAYYEPYKEEK